MSEPVCEAALRTAASVRPGGQQDQRLARVPQCAGSVEEGAPVDDVLGVDGDGARPVVVDAGPHEVDEPQVRLVAERDEAGDPEPAVSEQGGEIEDEVAALAQHRHVAGGQDGVRELEVRSWCRRRRGSWGRRSTAPAARATATASASSRAPSAPASDSPAVIADDRSGPGRDGVGHRGHEPGGRHADHHEVDAAAWARAAACAEGYVARPSTSPPRRLTSGTVRSPGEASARWARMCPHFAGSSLAPTTATVRGAKRASSRSTRPRTRRSTTRRAALDPSRDATLASLTD